MPTPEQELEQSIKNQVNNLKINAEKLWDDLEQLEQDINEAHENCVDCPDIYVDDLMCDLREIINQLEL